MGGGSHVSSTRRGFAVLLWVPPLHALLHLRALSRFLPERGESLLCCLPSILFDLQASPFLMLWPEDKSSLGLGGQLSSPEALLGTHLRPTLQERRGNRTDENFTT